VLIPKICLTRQTEICCWLAVVINLPSLFTRECTTFKSFFQCKTSSSFTAVYILCVYRKGTVSHVSERGCELELFLFNLLYRSRCLFLVYLPQSKCAQGMTFQTLLKLKCLSVCEWVCTNFLWFFSLHLGGLVQCDVWRWALF